MLPSLFISHGAPMLALEPGESGPALARLAANLPRPKAIVIVSAHWESSEHGSMGTRSPRPGMTSAASRRNSSPCSIRRAACRT
jgi:4,5-DOPA dioxygenase extradiol